ncbi:MAG: hypothetical protein JST58_09090 [Bacteroidetes bacterium]|nr:hypothetical protein [Bacteroidota bacterium]
MRISGSKPVHSHKGLLVKKQNPVWKKFFEWANAEDSTHHAVWAGLMITSMTTLLFPLAMALILIHGASAKLIWVAVLAFLVVDLSNMSSLKMRNTLAIFLLSSLCIIAAAAASFLIP